MRGFTRPKSKTSAASSVGSAPWVFTRRRELLIERPRSIEDGTVAGCQRSWQRSAPWLTSDHNFEAELERPVCPQVVAGPRSEPTTNQAGKGGLGSVKSPQKT